MDDFAFDLSIVVPAYNEAVLVESSLKELAAFLQDRPNYGRVEVVVVVADSPDGTVELARSQTHLFDHLTVMEAGPRKGKGRDVRLGMLASQGRNRVFMDADLATPLGHLDEVVQLFEQGAEVGIAVRDLLRIHDSWVRRWVSKTSNVLAQALLLPGIKDTQCGFKFFSATATIVIFERQTMMGWSFDMEILVIARCLGYEIHQIEAPDWAEPKSRGLVGDAMLGVLMKVALDPFRILIRRATGGYRTIERRTQQG